MRNKFKKSVSLIAIMLILLGGGVSLAPKAAVAEDSCGTLELTGYADATVASGQPFTIQYGANITYTNPGPGWGEANVYLIDSVTGNQLAASSGIINYGESRSIGGEYSVPNGITSDHTYYVSADLQGKTYGNNCTALADNSLYINVHVTKDDNSVGTGNACVIDLFEPDNSNPDYNTATNLHYTLEMSGVFTWNISSNGTNIASGTNTDGAVSTGSLTSAKTYTLTCGDATPQTRTVTPKDQGSSNNNNNNTNLPNISLTASPTSMTLPTNSTQLTWTTSNSPTLCTASNAWSGNKATGGGSQTINGLSAGIYTYTMTCYNGDGSSNDSVTVNVDQTATTCFDNADVTMIQDLPTGNLIAGQNYNFTVRSKNTGSSWWYHGSVYKLQQGGTLTLNPTYGHLNNSIHTGDYDQWNFTLTAPSTPGNYNLNMQMIHDFFVDGSYQRDDGTPCGAVTQDSTFGNILSRSFSVAPACASGTAWNGTACVSTTTPALSSVTISSPTVKADGATRYTITVRANDSGGAAKITQAFANINLGGSNAGSYRGYLTWSADPAFTGWNAEKNKQSCTGGGIAAVQKSGGNSIYGYQYITLDSCSNTVSGNMDTTVFTVYFDPAFTAPISNNDISGFTQNSNDNNTGWVNFDINFGLAIPSPTNLAAFCSGTDANLSWTLPSGFVHSYLRVKDVTTGANIVSVPESSPDYGPSFSMAGTLGHTYSWTVQTRSLDETASTPAVAGTNFTCVNNSSYPVLSVGSITAQNVPVVAGGLVAAQPLQLSTSITNSGLATASTFANKYFIDVNNDNPSAQPGSANGWDLSYATSTSGIGANATANSSTTIGQNGFSSLGLPQGSHGVVFCTDWNGSVSDPAQTLVSRCTPKIIIYIGAPSQNGVCANGATNPPICDENNLSKCVNGATNPPVCIDNVIIDIDKEVIYPGDTVTLVWDSPGAISCTSTNFSNPSNSISSPANGLTLSPASTTTYSLSCNDGTSGSVTVVVKKKPQYIEK